MASSLLPLAVLGLGQVHHGHGRTPRTGKSGTGPALQAACGQVLGVGRLCLLPKVFTGGDMQGLFQTATDSNLLLIKTVQKTFGNRLRDPALFMRRV